MSRRLLVSFAVLLALSFAVASCGKKAETAAASGATSDSLLSSTPVEQPQGQIPPQGNVPTPEAAPSGTPASTPTPEHAAKTPAPKKSHESTGHAQSRTPEPAAEVTVPGGTSLAITMGTALTSESAKPGDAWSGTLKEALTIGSAAPFPAGSVVSGVVDGVEPAAKGSRAYLVLRVTSIAANGQTHSISATADSLVAGSTRKRNIGAIAGGAAAGALLGKALGGSGKGAVIGGILGGAAATGAVAASKGFQVTVDQGKDMVFKVDHDTRVKL